MTVRCTLLGTAAALPSASRDNTALLFQGDTSALLVDCPGGAYAKLLRAGLVPTRLSHLLLTHRHTDHTSGLPGLLQSLWLAGREAPLPILGVLDVQTLVDRAVAAYQPFGSRAPFALPRQTLPESAVATQVLETLDFRVWTVATAHSVPCVAVRVEARESGASVVYSSDTGPCPAVINLAAGAQLLVHEATYSDVGSTEAAQLGHSTATQAADVAHRAGASALWLVHFTPNQPTDLATHQAEAAARFRRPVAVPEDLASHEF